MKRFLTVAAIFVLLFGLTALSEAQTTTCTGTSVNCSSNAGGAGGQGGNATGGNATATTGNQTNQQTNDQTNQQTNQQTNDQTNQQTNQQTTTQTQSQGDQSQSNKQETKVSTPVQPVPVPSPNITMPNATQPIKPEGWVNNFAFKPSKMTYEQAERCAGGNVESSWDGGKVKMSRSIILFWLDNMKFPTADSMDNYVGTAKASDYERSSSMAVLCSAALKAMRNGAEVGFVDYVHRPENHTSSRGIGGTFGFSGVPGGGGNPYAIAGGGGPMFGSSDTHVRGRLIVHIQGFCGDPCQDQTTKKDPGDYKFTSDLYSSN
ncbi:MAG: hypothetical protein HYW89_03355 [Candidatus Sungiibacteriota bacterium]|uniref:Uncharacterized protein n=1 Tax=Candidatus Sungiibacteriota bacterium TaxID=2750080 RepID=A0A7T5RJ22_9BACT|nr:MAG: hypothetical protein HYW89_03355 [Candidatus Sungbacteria bacterium]